jgi:hypothetical protein
VFIAYRRFRHLGHSRKRLPRSGEYANGPAAAAHHNRTRRGGGCSHWGRYERSRGRFKSFAGSGQSLPPAAAAREDPGGDAQATTCIVLHCLSFSRRRVVGPDSPHDSLTTSACRALRRPRTGLYPARVDGDAIRVPSGTKGMRSRWEGPRHLSWTFVTAQTVGGGGAVPCSSWLLWTDGGPMGSLVAALAWLPKSDAYSPYVLRARVLCLIEESCLSQGVPR